MSPKSTPKPMTTLAIGPGLASFPAFPDPASLDPTQLGFVITDRQLSFSLSGYQFEFTGDFSSIPEPRVLNFLSALAPGIPQAAIPLITLASSRVTRMSDGQTVIGFSGSTTTLPVNLFFGTLLDPRNFTDDILTVFFGDIGRFTQLDLSAFSNGVFLGASNGPVLSPEGEIGVVAFASETDGFRFTHILGGAGADVLFGSDQADHLIGDRGDDKLFGLGGDDHLSGGPGADSLLGGDGDDVLTGGFGDDTLLGEAGNNVLTGGPGADRFIASPGTQRITDFSRAEGDKIDLSGLGYPAIISLQKALSRLAQSPRTAPLALSLSSAGTTSTLIFEGISRLQFSDFTLLPQPSVAFGHKGRRAAPWGHRPGCIIGTPRADQLYGGDSDETLLGKGGDDFLAGGDGDDWLQGDRGADILWGDRGDDQLHGNQQADLLYGGEGNDQLHGGLGDDILDGGPGDDLLLGGAGRNTLTGGPGADRFSFRQLTGELDRITDFDIGQDRIDLRGVIKGVLTAQTLTDFLQITSPGPTELTRFVALDPTGSGSQFTPLFQIDDVPDAVLLDPNTYLF